MAIALPMLPAPVATARLVVAPEPRPVLNAPLNLVFTLSLAAGSSCRTLALLCAADAGTT